MEACETSQRSLPQKAQVYYFCIKFLRITGIRVPTPPIPGASSSKNRQRYFLKITILHGVEQQKIGEFEVVGDECVINQQLSCEIKYGRPDKLHVYIDQNWSAGLSGHITLDLKEFFEDADVEIYLEYPLFSSGSSHVRRTSKLQMSVLCTCSTKTNAFPDLIDPNQEYMYFEDLSESRPSLDDHWYPPVRLDTESSHGVPPLLLEGDSKQVSPSNLPLVKVDREIEMLKEMEGDLIELNSKLNKYVAGHSLEKYAPGQHRHGDPTRPEVMAAVFFAAGMAFQRQVDSACRLRMYRATDDPLLPGETPLLSGGNTPFLLEDVSPTCRGESSPSQDVQETDTLCPAWSRSFRISENSSRSCVEQKPWNCNNEITPSLEGEIHEDENDQNYFNSPIDAKDMPMHLPDPELVSSRTSNNTCSPHGEISPSKETMNVFTNETPIQKNSRKRKNKVLNILGSVIEAFAVVGLSDSGTKEIQFRGRKDERVTFPRSMLGRQEVTSIQKIRKSNPGLGWLTNSMKID